MSDPAPIIIIRKKKKQHHAHHGGAWKVAYADFVTAMMAFFLLMWLISATDDTTRKGISNYFSPIGSPDSGEGSGSILGGKSIQSPGAMEDATALKPPMPQKDVPDPKKLKDHELEKLIEEKESRLFKEVEKRLKDAVKDNPSLAKLAKNLLVDQTPEGMRIQIIDQNDTTMFPSGSSVMYDHTYQLLTEVAKIVSRMPNHISITGHTDATPYKNDKGYSNWELSADRANASRRVLLDAGLSQERIQYVVGKADQEPLLKDDPTSPQNRRISIVLLKTK